MQYHSLKLRGRRAEYGDVVTFRFERGRIDFAGGQYVWVKVDGPPNEYLERELSFASAPSDKELWLTVHLRQGSAFKRRLDALAPGDAVRLRDVRGAMVLPEPAEGPAVMVAQGIGAAPYRSLLRQARHIGQDLDAAIVHVAREGHLFADEFADLASAYEPIGRSELDERLKYWRTQRPRAAWYVAGSPEFVASMSRKLGMLGVPYRGLRTTMFEAYADGAE